jgi:protoheme ferro-lyase
MSVGVILTTYGEPSRHSFTEQWMYSYRILERLTRKIAPIPKPVLPIIATSRARGRVKLWRENDFTSPLESLHERTVAALRDELARRGRSEEVVLTRAYEFRRPGLTDALRELDARGCLRAIIVPMYVGGGDFTDGMTHIAVQDAQSALPHWTSDRLDYCFLSDLPADAERMAQSLARHGLETMRSRGVPAPAPDWALLLAAHGTVVNPPPGVDNGLLSFGRVLGRVRDLLKPQVGLVRFGWLNHTRGGKWTTPAVADAFSIIRNRGYKKLIYFPWGFTTDNAETALEGHIALRDFKDAFDRVEYLPCVNTSPDFISLLADRVCRHLGGLDRTPIPEHAATA